MSKSVNDWGFVYLIVIDWVLDIAHFYPLPTSSGYTPPNIK